MDQVLEGLCQTLMGAVKEKADTLNVPQAQLWAELSDQEQECIAYGVLALLGRCSDLGLVVKWSEIK